VKKALFTILVLSVVSGSLIVATKPAQAKCKFFDVLCRITPKQGTIKVSRPNPDAKTFSGIYYTKPKFNTVNLPQLYLDNNFTQTEENALWDGYSYLNTHLITKPVMDCMTTYSSNLPNAGNILASGVYNNRKLKLFVHKGGDPQNPFPPRTTTVANATKNSVSDSGKFTMNFNPDQIKPNKNKNWVSQEATMAGFLGHEMFHNLNYDHAQLQKDSLGNTIFTPAFGNEVYESGWCIARNGGSKTAGTYGLDDALEEIGGLYVDGLESHHATATTRPPSEEPPKGTVHVNTRPPLETEPNNPSTEEPQTKDLPDSTDILTK
jgi:hypothetical protein